jgi:hypothetical protein
LGFGQKFKRDDEEKGELGRQAVKKEEKYQFMGLITSLRAKRSLQDSVCGILKQRVPAE